MSMHEIEPRHFPTSRVIKLGLHKTPEAYAAAIEAKGNRICKWHWSIIAKVICSQKVVDLELVDVSGADLGLTWIYTTRDLYERAATFGLYPCPAEVGLALRDQWDDQPKVDYRIAMEAIADSDDDPHLLIVAHNEGWLLLDADSGHPERQWGSNARWILTPRKP